MTDDGTDDRLMVGLAAGDEEALRKILRRHGDGVLNFLVQLTGDRDGAEDLTQETFLRVYRHASRYVPGGGFRAWIYTIARHLAHNHGRDHALRMEREPATPPPRPSREGRESPELQRAIDQAIDGVREPFRSALILCVLQGLSYEEAAAVSGCSVKTLSTRLVRGRERFRELIAPYLSNGGRVRLEGR